MRERSDEWLTIYLLVAAGIIVGVALFAPTSIKAIVAFWITAP